MKSIRNLLLIIAVLLFNIAILKAQCVSQVSKSDTTENVKEAIQSFKVEGKCEMCQNRIEKAALSVKGVKNAKWDPETNLLSVSLKKVTLLDDVYQAVAKAGHDNEKYKSEEKDYNALPGCCLYR
jgi:Cu(I)/Ag(I) efflux system membrane fusion protein